MKKNEIFHKLTFIKSNIHKGQDWLEIGILEGISYREAQILEGLNFIESRGRVKNSRNIREVRLKSDGEVYTSSYAGLIGKVELFSICYPFISALIIGFMGGLGATILNIFLK